MDSVQGFLDRGILYLPIECKDRANLRTAELIIIRDHLVQEPSLANDPSACENILPMDQPGIPRSFDIFRIKKQGLESYEIMLDYASSSTAIGIPGRQNHKLFDLKKSVPLRYRINGKSDFTLSGRKERTFHEFDFIIEWRGKAEKIEFLELNTIRHKKIIPLDHYKLVDERKALY